MIFKNKLQSHKNIKNKLLELIENTVIEKQFSNISHSDFNSSNDNSREYVNIFIENVKPILNKISNKIKTKDWQIDNIWFQQYLKNDLHSWHTHIGAHFTNIYFLELPKKEYATEVLGYKIHNINEGDVLSFPAYFLHRSKKINTNIRKTIISFNTSFFHYNNKLV